jgi:hypothetical protein
MLDGVAFALLLTDCVVLPMLLALIAPLTLEMPAGGRRATNNKKMAAQHATERGSEAPVGSLDTPAKRVPYATFVDFVAPWSDEQWRFAAEAAALLDSDPFIDFTLQAAKISAERATGELEDTFHVHYYKWCGRNDKSLLPQPDDSVTADMIKCDSWSPNDCLRYLKVARRINGDMRKVLVCAAQNGDAFNFKRKYGEYWRSRMEAMPKSMAIHFEKCLQSYSHFIETTYRNPASETQTTHQVNTQEKIRTVFAGFADTVSKFKARERDIWSSSWCIVPLSPVSVSSNTPESVIALKNLKRVRILCGESGSGKSTQSLLTSLCGIYLHSRDFGELRTSLAQHTGDAGVRNAMVSDGIVSAVTKIVTAMKIPPYTQSPTEGSLQVSIVVDEVGTNSMFLRGMCGALAEIQTGVENIFRQCGMSVIVALIAVGTGVDAATAEPGSEPASYKLLTMPMTSAAENVRTMVGIFKQSLVCEYSTSAKSVETLLDAVDEHPHAKHLIQNPRFAKCLFKRVCERQYPAGYADLFPTVDAALFALDGLLMLAARDFRDLNGMSDYSFKEIVGIYRSALKVMYTPVKQHVKTEDVELLLAKGGVLTDGAFWVAARTVKPTHCTLLDTSEDGACLYAPSTGRYRMSMAQQLLFRMHYGFSVLEPSASWQRYEAAVAEYVATVTAALCGRPLLELFERLHVCEAAKKRVDCALSTTTSFDGVAVLRNARQITSATESSDLAHLQTYMDANTAIVVLNAAGAPYADVVVMIPKTAVILIQANVYAERSSMPNLKPEYDKLVSSKGLATVCGVKTDKFFRLLVTTKSIATTQLCGFGLLCTADSNALAPLFTPLPENAVIDTHKEVLRLSTADGNKKNRKRQRDGN